MTIDEKRGIWRVWEDEEVVARFSSEKEAKKFVKESAAPIVKGSVMSSETLFSAEP